MKPLTLTSNLTFALYRLPGSKTVQFTMQRTPNKGEAVRGFLIRPFRADAPEVIIHAEVELENPALHWAIDLPKMHEAINGKSDYLQKATKFVTACQGDLHKAILSRKKQVIHNNLNPLDFFYKLEKAYSSAFVYLCYTPQYGCWTGATPEHLLQAKAGRGKTVSLAGTQSAEVFCWSEKERDEQEWVSRHIRQLLSQRGIIFSETTPETVKAGGVVHLKSTFDFDLPDGEVFLLAKALHPTPAVCGFPQNEALQFILKHEGYDRQIYTGYLGPFSPTYTELFVNLRCAQVFQSGLELYLGGGITQASEPMKEWEETELKSKTLLNVLEK